MKIVYGTKEEKEYALHWFTNPYISWIGPILYKSIPYCIKVERQEYIAQWLKLIGFFKTIGDKQ